MWQLLTIIVLFGLMGGLSYLPTPDPTNLVAATGFVLLAAFTMGELFKRIRLPSLLGYIFAGIIFGPELATILSSEGSQNLALLPRDLTDTDKLAYVEILTVGVIGTMGGGELKVADLRDQLGTILKIVGLTFVAIVPLSAAAVYGLATYAPEFVPFLQGVPTTTLISVSVMFGVFGFAMSPAATLAIIQESNAKGSFTSMVLGVVIVADLVLVASYLVTFAFSEILIETGSLAWAPIMASLPTIGAEFMWALIIGGVTGLLFILYVRFVGREMIFFTVGTIFATSYVCNALHAEKLLAFITAGFIVQNLSKHGHDMIEALERISLPAFVVYFTIKAAGLNLQGVVDFIVLTGVLTVIRTGAIWLTVKKILPNIAPSLRPDHKRYLWLSFFSRGGVDLVLAGLLASRTGPGWGWTMEFQAVIMAIVAIHLVGGPPLLKLALDNVGETSDGDSTDKEESEEPLDDQIDFDLDALLDHPFPRADVDDPELTEHLDELRTAYTDIFRARLVQPVRQHNREVQQITERVESELADAVDDLESTLRAPESDESLQELSETVRKRHLQFRQNINPQIETLEELETAPVNARAMDELLEEIRELEAFETHFQVDWGSEMLQADPEDGAGMRFVKFSRRVVNSFFGGVTRTVPSGRLWRFFVELSVPDRLAQAAEETCNRDERFWFEFGEYIRRVDQLYERVYLILEYALSNAPRSSEDPEFDDQKDFDVSMMVPLSASPPWIPFSDESGEADFAELVDLPSLVDIHEGDTAVDVDVDDTEWVQRALRAVQSSRNRFEERADYLAQERNAIRRAELEQYTLAMRGPYTDFLDGIARAGTIRLPAFRYRPSSKFDHARRAETRLLERLDHHTDLIGGYRGWIIVDQQLILFLHWFDDYRDRIIGVLEREIRQQCLEALDQLETRCSERLHDLRSPNEGQDEVNGVQTADIDWEDWLSDHITPSIHRARQALNSSLVELGQGRATQQLLMLLEDRIEQFSERVKLLDELPHDALPEGPDVDIIDVPLRQWFRDELLRDATLRFVEFNDHAERGLRRSLVSLHDVEQILEFNLGTGQRRLKDEGNREQMNEMAEGGLDRAASRITEISEALLRDEGQLRRWSIQKISRGTCQVAGPFLQDDVREIPGRIEEASTSADGDAGSADSLFEPLRRRWRSVGKGLRGVARQFSDELRAALAETTPVPSRDQIRERLQRRPSDNTELPVIYRRLFSPIPVDIPEFYVRRQTLETACLQAAERWFRGNRASVLMYGDRGTGKRTLVKHLLPQRLFDTYPDLEQDRIHTIEFGTRVETEAAIGKALSPLVGGDSVTSLETLAGRLHSDGQRRIVFIEDAAHLFVRTRQGFELFGRFLQFVSNTSDRILWYVTLGKPAATLLDTTLDLFDYFTHTLEVGPLDEETLREMIFARHRVSGFQLEFEPLEPRILDSIRHPVVTSDRIRHPERAYFERLARLSQGNPLLALLYWLESARHDPEDDTLLRVKPLPRQEVSLSHALSLRQKLLVAAIIQHSTISVERAASVVQAERSEVQAELNHLQRLGFIEVLPAHRELYRMCGFAEPLVTRELRRENLL